MALKDVKNVLIKAATDKDFREKILNPEHKPLPLEELAKTAPEEIKATVNEWAAKAVPQYNLSYREKRVLYELTHEKLECAVLDIDKDLKYIPNDIRI